MLRRITLAFLVALLAVSCAENPTQPAEQAGATEPDANYMNGPEQPGPTVYRSENGQMFVWTFPGDATPDGEDWSVMFSIGDVADLLSCGGSGTPYPGHLRYGDEGSSGHSKLTFNAFLDDVDTGEGYHAHWNFAWAWSPSEFDVLADNMFLK